METRDCRWCGFKGTPIDERGTSQCPSCKRWDAVECFSCRTTDGFPVPEDRVTVEVAMSSPILRNDLLTERSAQAHRITWKGYVYCARCYHNAYFVVSPTPETKACLLCSTEWDRLTAAVHKD